MNKYLKLHIDQASQSTRRRFRIATVVAKLIGIMVMTYAVMLSLWYCMTVVFAMTPGM
jgi:hypothetical protein